MAGPGARGRAETRGHAVLRVIGLAIALGAAAGAVFVVFKLYSGRGADAPLRSAAMEQPLVVLLGLAGIALGIWMALFPGQVIAARAWLNPRYVWRERRGEAALLWVGTLVGLLLLEGASRALYARSGDLPFFYPLPYAVYPALHTEMRDYDADATNVLLLGGSVLWGVGKNHPDDALCRGCRVYNLAQPAHSSLDSLTKYQYLAEQGYRFDYVVFYHGINETRANNVPPEQFSSNYNHYFFYRLVNTVFHGRKPWLRAGLNSALVFRLNRLATDLRQTRFFGRRGVHLAFPREDWLQYGRDIKSAKPFETNVLAVADLAGANGAQLVVLEFAYDPVIDRYAAGDDDGPSRTEMVRYTEQWGLPEHVRAGMRAHNEVLAAHRDRYVYRTTETLRRSNYFVDPCHFTNEGENALVDLIRDALAEGGATERGDEAA